MKNVFASILGIALLSAAAAPIMADVELHPLFTDNAVLQQGMPIPVWGWADDGEKITVSIAGKTAETTAKDGKWMVKLDALEAGGPYEMTVQSDKTVARKNILIGEVWVCSGQSNMQWNVQNSNNAEQEIQTANYPLIRLFSVPLTCSGRPQENVDAKWELCTSETVPGFSAVAYFFGRELFKSINIPIGLIHTSWGGSSAEAWTTRETLENNPDLKYLVERWDGLVKESDQNWKNYIDELNKWREQALEREQAGERYVYPPQAPRNDNRHSNHRPAGLYNAMIAPIIPYAIQGAIWYQGESNAGRAYQYRTLFPAMIQDWRDQWGYDLSFLFVQLANFEAKWGGVDTWPELREAQTMTLEMPKTGMAVTIDIGNPTDIHPRNKQDVGYRLALAARKVTYGEDNLVYSGPMYKSMKVEDGKIRLWFDCVGSGLMAQGNQPLKGFTIAGEDKNFAPAGARIENDTIVVWSQDVKNPVAVRYAWQDNPECNLFNKQGLPASPFRTDEWPGVTVDNK
ncbi:MAG: sialate O-acetylesterase [Candidatus Omnitrophica bacterium]|nr:sialate O-acetylesterase [Candidatus Omnitrophota bacterium]